MRRCPRSTFVGIADSGHFVMLDQPQASPPRSPPSSNNRLRPQRGTPTFKVSFISALSSLDSGQFCLGVLGQRTEPLFVEVGNVGCKRRGQERVNLEAVAILVDRHLGRRFQLARPRCPPAPAQKTAPW